MPTYNPNFMNQYGLSRFLGSRQRTPYDFMKPAQTQEDTSVLPSTSPDATVTPPRVISPEDYTNKYLSEEQELLKNQPKYADYKPNLLTKILAGATGALSSYAGNDIGKSIEIGHDVRDAQFRGASQDWARKAASLKALSDTEKERINEIAARAKAQQDADKAQRDADVARSTIGLNNARAADLNSNKRDWVRQVNKVDGHLYSVNINTGQKLDLGQYDPSMKEAELAEIEKAKKIATIGQGTHSVNRLFDVQHPVPITYNPTVAPGQQQDARILAIQNVIAKNPQYAQYVTKDQNGKIIGAEYNPDATFPSSEPGVFGGLFGGSGAQQGDATSNWNQAQKLIEEEMQRILSTQRNTPPSFVTPPSAPVSVTSPGAGIAPTVTGPPRGNLGGAAPPVVAPPGPLNPASMADAALRQQVIKDIRANFPNRPDLLTNESYIQGEVNARKAKGAK